MYRNDASDVGLRVTRVRPDEDRSNSMVPLEVDRAEGVIACYEGLTRPAVGIEGQLCTFCSSAKERTAPRLLGVAAAACH
jgi:hypothetical protein